NSEAEQNVAYLRDVPEESEEESENHGGSDEEDWKDEVEDMANEETSWIDGGKSSFAKEKLIEILNGDALVPKQRWSLRKILATLMHHRTDKRLWRPFGQLRGFFCETMMKETRRDGRWPGALRKRDYDTAIRLRFRSEVENRYGQEVHRLCRTSGSAFGSINVATSGGIDLAPLDAIVNQVQFAALLMVNLVQSVGPSSRSETQLVLMKLVAIMVILCRSAHRNNSNYVPLLVALYMYSVSARIDAITIFNHLGLSVSYGVLLKRLRAISESSMATIKAQSTNPKLVGAWDNFEYRENVNGERVGDRVKFRSITMALWIKSGWKISSTGLKQAMWDSLRGLLVKIEDVTVNAFGHAAQFIQKQCFRSHRFMAFRTAFPDKKIDYASPMPRIKVIDCTKEGKTEAFAFAPSMHSESSLAGSIAVFEDLNVRQMGIEPLDAQWNDRLTIWWGDLKTEILMRSMQNQDKNEKLPYHQYRHIFPGLALWHLRFNYLKMIWELFYPEGSATERFTLQWAADHWHRDKTTKPTDFHSLEDLTIHRYRARKLTLRLHDNNAFGVWLSTLTLAQWKDAFDWLDDRMDDEMPDRSTWNDHWKNHVRFCRAMEPYMTLCHAIKHGDTGLLWHAMREVAIILQPPVAAKPKYARAMLRQLHIFDTKAATPVLQEAYLANALVNLRGLPNTFYEMDLLLEHQNGEFKRFQADRGSSLQESNELFHLHALSVETLRTVRSGMNRVVIGHQRKGYHLQKDASFDILSLADQLHRSHSTNLEKLLPGRDYFSENNVPDLLRAGKHRLPSALEAYSKSSAVKDKMFYQPDVSAELDGQNEQVLGLFSRAQDEAFLTADHQGMEL
ncbi:hypothetical protein MMC07_002735, partial [Pseudocyphellaria aurata]|nr:hypothetical protein [Pseudocyphellaria aurata]